ncbi:hypothetical protein [Actinomadura sediminis]|uniref:Cell division protein FtsL n=1 Tax=Actinomadura sediminis TaxID=1038904 RepID=A0ABW3F060_9ACTN
MTTTSRRPPRTPPKPSRGKTAAKRAPAKKPPKAPAETPVKTSAKAPAKAPVKAAKAAVETRTRPAVKPAAERTSRAGAAPGRAGQSPPRTPFILLIVGLLGGALVSLLLLNTVLAKDAFTITRLQQSNERLEERQQELELQNAQERSPEKIAERAESLGMKQYKTPVFFDADTGRPSGHEIRPVPHADAAAAGAASVIGVPGTVVPGDGAAR